VKKLPAVSFFRKKSLSDSPIFIFAASWRTGSTLLQRILNASGEVFIWGEPAFLPQARALYERTRTYFEKVKYNRNRAFAKTVGKWIPVVSPLPEGAIRALKLFFEELYGRETIALGLKRWGFKEVRAGAVENIIFLKKLYPQAKFLFLVRNPYDTYKSLKGKKFHHDFQNSFEPIDIWSNNVREFFAHEEVQKYCLLVRYEDIVKASKKENAELKKIAAHVGISLRDAMYEELAAKVDSSGAEKLLTSEETATINSIVAETASLVHYELL